MKQRGCIATGRRYLGNYWADRLRFSIRMRLTCHLKAMAWVPTLKNGGNKIFRFYIDVTQFNRVSDQKVGGSAGFDENLHCWACPLVGLTTVDMSIRSYDMT